MINVALISMPWLSPYRPSIQLGALQAYLRSLPDVCVDALHEHLEVTRFMPYPLVKAIADGEVSAWLGEAIAAYLLFPDRQKIIRRFIDYLLTRAQVEIGVDDELLAPFSSYLQQRLDEVQWRHYALVGLSVCSCQTLTSLLMARMLRRHHPDPLLVLGGPSVIGPVGASLLQAFPEIDCVVSGEGEQTLSRLVVALRDGAAWHRVPGVLSRVEGSPGEATEIDCLDDLPTPDYHSYFGKLSNLECSDQVHADLQIPVEGSRGCWWQMRHGPCRFCNLNLQWRSYRVKSVERQLRELGSLVEQHSARRMIFVDTVARRRRSELVRLFGAIRDGFDPKLEIEMEARASLSLPDWQLLGDAGVTRCQLGIESLSMSILNRLGKGVTPLVNLAAMKEMERLGIANPGNLLYDLPEITPEQMDECTAAIAFACAYHPLAATRLILNYGSPYYDDFLGRPDFVDSNYRAWQILVPAGLNVFFTQRDHELTSIESEAGGRLATACAEWHRHYFAQKKRGERFLLSIRRQVSGGLTVRDLRGPSPLEYSLDGPEAELYLLFDSPRAIAGASANLPHISPQRMEDILTSLERRRLVYRERGIVLGLALWDGVPRPNEG